ncbi:MAG: hypothetical protein DRP78_06640 [Candidatus Omnitrophota bacterium]|nr:MAG: hypothetical protein DRP78_06640 [Candidatus Omnitrophota bacterium]
MQHAINLGDLQSSVLKEMANVGISHVAIVLEKVFGEKIEISLPELKIFSKKQLIKDEITQETSVCAYFEDDKISDITEALLFFSRKDADVLIRRFIELSELLDVNVGILSIDELESIFCEISTMLISTYFSAVGVMFNFQPDYHPPQVSFKNAELLKFIDLSLRNNTGISINISFVGGMSKIKGNFLLILEYETLDKFFKTLGFEPL